MTGVLVAVGPRWDSRLATTVEAARDLELARRCADLADLLAAAASGLGTAAVVSGDLRGLDLTAVSTLRASGVAVVGVSDPVDEGSERHLRQIGVDVVVPADVAAADLAESVLAASAAPGGAGAPASGRHEAAGVVSSERVVTPSAFPPVPEAEPQEPARVVAVWGPCGAPGRTSVAVNLAAELALLGVPTLLVDADTYGGSVAQVLSLLDEAPGVAAAARAAEQGTLDLPVLARLAPEVLPGLRVLTGLPRADRWPELRQAALERVYDVARLLARVVVVDCGFSLEDDEELSYDTRAPRRHAATLTSLATADTVVAVGACDPVGLQRLVRGLQELGTVPSGEVLVVVNRLRAGAVGPRPAEHVTAALQRFAGVVPATFVPDDPAAFDAALLQGRVLAECAPSSPARAALRTLAATLGGVDVPSNVRRRKLITR
ncbi:hypothetical protein V3N99_04395 [Dermatophilaceae bacterium Soc4.6]